MNSIRHFIRLTLRASVFIALAVLSSYCSKTTDPISGEISQTAVGEAAMLAMIEELDDMVVNQLNKFDAAPGRVEATYDDDRTRCAMITKNANNGWVQLDFGSGCSDGKGNVRKGVLMVTTGLDHWYAPGNTYTIWFFSYAINGVRIGDQDTRMARNISTIDSPMSFLITTDLHLTWPDGTVAIRQGKHIRQWIRNSDFTKDTMLLSPEPGTSEIAAGTNRHDRTYAIQITSALEYTRNCQVLNKVFKPVRGALSVTFDAGKSAVIDFGDGSCKNSFTINVGSNSRSVTAKNDSSND